MKTMELDTSGPHPEPSSGASLGVPHLTNAELVQLHIRVIALENLVVALLAQGSVDQLELARNMALYISPRAGFTPHPLTIHAAAQMVHFVERAEHFRGMSA
jgi:hypothetical protein